MSPFLTRHVSTKSCYIFYCPRTKVFSALSPLLFLFFFLTRCVSPLDLPCAGPHDSFSTDILKGPKLSLPPMPFSFFPLLSFLSFSVLRLLLLDCLSLQCLSGSLERKLGRNEAYVESPQPKGWCLWTTLAASHQTAQVSHMHWWVHPQDCTLMEANPPPEGHDKGGFYVGFFYFPDLSMGGGELHLHPLLVLLLWSDLPVLPAPFFPLLFSSWIWIDLTVYVTLFVKMWSVICKLQSNCLFSFFILWEKDVKSIGVTLCWTRSLSK